MPKTMETFLHALHMEPDSMTAYILLKNKNREKLSQGFVHHSKTSLWNQDLVIQI